MKKESKNKMYVEWAVMLVLLVGLLILSKKIGFVENLKPDTSAGKVLVAIGIVFFAFIVLGVHELGHLVTGLMNGFRFELFVVGPFGFKRENDKVKMYLNKNLGYYGGVAATSPIDDNKGNAKKFAQILLAGPIASVLFAIVCFTIAYFIGKPLGMVIYTGGVISIAIFFATTIPSKSGMFFTDRKRYQRLVNPGKDQDVELAMLSIMGKFGKDNSYKNVDKNDINVLVADELPFIKYYGLYNLVCYQLELDGEVDEETTKAYEDLSETMSKNLVTAFNAEIEKYREKLNTETSNA